MCVCESERVVCVRVCVCVCDTVVSETVVYVCLCDNEDRRRRRGEVVGHKAEKQEPHTMMVGKKCKTRFAT